MIGGIPRQWYSRRATGTIRLPKRRQERRILGRGETFLLARNSGQTVERAWGLMSCASLIYYGNVGDAYVHHANTGDVGRGGFKTAISALNTAAVNAWIIYAHPNNTDAGYQDI
jgi:hypothetical protein